MSCPLSLLSPLISLCQVLFSASSVGSMEVNTAKPYSIIGISWITHESLQSPNHFMLCVSQDSSRISYFGS